MTLTWRRLPLGLTITTFLALVILLSLGTWQLARLKWKADLVHAMALRENSSPVAVATALSQKDAAWQPVVLKACALNTKIIVPMHSSLGEKIGFRWLTYCQNDGQTLLLDLGFSEHSNPEFAPVTSDIVGHLRPIEPKNTFAVVNDLKRLDFYWREPALLAQALKVPIRPDYFVVVDVEKSHLKIETLQQAPMTAPLTNRHLEYALTWYGLALSLLGVYGGVVFNALKAKPNDA